MKEWRVLGLQILLVAHWISLTTITVTGKQYICEVLMVTSQCIHVHMHIQETAHVQLQQRELTQMEYNCSYSVETPYVTNIGPHAIIPRSAVYFLWIS